MAYTDFDLDRVQGDFGLALVMTEPLFGHVAPAPISAGLAAYWALNRQLGTASVSEKARSEILISPLVNEVWHRSNRRVMIWSGLGFNVDAAAGLTGVCDFALGVSAQTLRIQAPVLTVVEGKRDCVADGLGQCAAEMVAAVRFNRAAGNPIDPVYGCVTTGVSWKFLRLSGTALDVDIDEYSVPTDADKILGIVLHCCGVTA